MERNELRTETSAKPEVDAVDTSCACISTMSSNNFSIMPTTCQMHSTIIKQRTQKKTHTKKTKKQKKLKHKKILKKFN
jgi:hypothetical protein